MDVQILEGNVLETLKQIEAGSVRTCVTSPPYYGLRSYLKKDDPLKVHEIGSEKTPEEYVAKLVQVFREVWRALADDGTLWLNLGDTYASSWAAGRRSIIGNGSRTNRINRLTGDLKEKDLIGIPWMVAFALRADGWYLRQDIIWHKPNPMPESVTDRCTKAHEYIFLLSKSRQYYFDQEAIEEAANYDGRNDTVMKGSEKYKDGEHLANGNANSLSVKGRERWKFKNLQREEEGIKPHSMHKQRAAGEGEYLSAVRNKRSVWTVTTKPYKEAHFATFPPDLIEPCILAGSAKGDTVLDPFGGSGTTAAVALKHGRRAILCELNGEYIPLIQKRLSQVQPVML